MWIEGGKLIEVGDVETVCENYSNYVDQYNAMSDKEKKRIRDEKFAEREIIEQKTSLINRIIRMIK